ncbi:hypothetical protein AA313_de0206939 [Arthrobotrys entomopaga]|nr:hypothetical protein AA313_de0206939 [Arthrobotrys entomopaga]
MESEIRLAPTKETFQKPKRQKMRESRLSNKVDGEARKNKKKEKPPKATGKQVKIAVPAFGRLASSAVESERISGGRLTVRPQIAGGLFHKGRVSVLKTRTALPDLSFSEMEFLRQRVPADYQNQVPECKDWSKPLAQERISSYFPKIASPKQENTDPNPIIERENPVNPPKNGNNYQSETQPNKTERHIPISIYSSSGTSRTRHGRLQTAPTPIIRKSKTLDSVLNLSPHKSSKSVFGSLSVNSSGGELESYSKLESSEIGDPIVAWLWRIPRDYDPVPENSRTVTTENSPQKPGHSISDTYVNPIRSKEESFAVYYPEHLARDTRADNAGSRWSREPNGDFRSSLFGEGSVQEEATVPSLDSKAAREALRWREESLQGPIQHFGLDGLTHSQAGDSQEIFDQTLQAPELSNEIENSLMRTANVNADNGYYDLDQERSGHYEAINLPPNAEYNLFRTALPNDCDLASTEERPGYEAIQCNEYDGLIEDNHGGTEFSSVNTGLRPMAETSSCFNSIELATEANEGFAVQGLNLYTGFLNKNERDHDANRESANQSYSPNLRFENASNNILESTRVFQDERINNGIVLRYNPVLEIHDELGPKNFWLPHRLY